MLGPQNVSRPAGPPPAKKYRPHGSILLCLSHSTACIPRWNPRGSDGFGSHGWMSLEHTTSANAMTTMYKYERSGALLQHIQPGEPGRAVEGGSIARSLLPLSFSERTHSNPDAHRSIQHPMLASGPWDEAKAASTASIASFFLGKACGRMRREPVTLTPGDIRAVIDGSGGGAAKIRVTVDTHRRNISA